MSMNLKNQEYMKILLAGKETLEERFAEKNLPVQIKTFHSFGLNIIAEK